MTSVSRERTFVFVCRYIEQHGFSPTLKEIGAELRISEPAASKHVHALVRERRLLRRGRERGLDIPGRLDLRPVPTDALVSELARRRAVAHAQASR